MTEKNCKIDTMGGQAVIEGVLMRSPEGYSIAIRRPSSGEIKIKSVPYTPLTKRHKLLGLPFIRGTITLFEMMVIGIKALDYSAQEWQEDIESAESRDKKENEKEEAKSDKAETPKPEKPQPKQSNFIAVLGMIVIALGLALFLMVVVPNLLTSYLGRLPIFGDAPGQQVVTIGPEGQEFVSSERSKFVEEHSPLLYNLIAGFLRAGIIIGYIFAISFMKDIRRVFQYHGAEHKTVYAYERGEPLTVENARKYSTCHPRCGTAFLAVVVFVSIIAFSLIAKVVITIYPEFTTMHFFVKKGILIFLHIMFMPIVAGTSYEVIRYASRHQEKWFMRTLIYPGILFQRMTTRNPNDDQIEVAIASLKSTLAISNPPEGGK